jgi:hypothetical protein
MELVSPWVMPPGRLRGRGGHYLVVGLTLWRGTAELISYAKLSQAVAIPLDIDNTNNSGREGLELRV